MKKDKWIRRWKVPGSNGNTWTVAQDKDGNYGCSCPRWTRGKYKREDCHHILAVKQNKGEPVDELSEMDRAELKLKALAQLGFRYHSWINEPPFPHERHTLEDLKRSPDIDQVRTFAFDHRRVIVIKETVHAYCHEFACFLDLLKKCNLRKKQVRNPFYRGVFYQDSFWISQAELRQALKKRWFDVTQHLIYNKTATVNPNLPKGSVYLQGEWGQRIHNLEKHFKFLR